MDYMFTSDEENLLDKLISTEVYSNIPELNNFTTVRDVCLCIKKKANSIIDRPISYTLRPIQWLYSQYSEKEAPTQQIASQVMQKKRLRSDSEERPQNSSASTTTAQIFSPPPEESEIPSATISAARSESTDEGETINILLLGETGVGKSTFINAFANYLTYDTLEQAQAGHPVVLIPVSFLITVGDHFDEHIMKLGDSNNEDFEHPGQSVTQHCRSYVLNLKRDDGKKLCIIDTPGFGDTRGLDQDDYNIAHILNYIKDLPHLDAVCFLLKPNESRLNMFYRSCLMQLSSFQKLNFCNNTLFCFTNARSTFYTPGDSAPLLKKMLSSPPMIDVPFKRDNTFCFDSESFRYLVALQNGISFNNLEREEYERSWTRSVIESKRLIHYIC